MERKKPKDVLQQMEVDATPSTPVGLVSVRTSPDITPGRDHVAVLMLNLLKSLMRMLNCL